MRPLDMYMHSQTYIYMHSYVRLCSYNGRHARGEDPDYDDDGEHRCSNVRDDDSYVRTYCSLLIASALAESYTLFVFS